MKKIIFGLIALGGLFLTSCDMKVKDSTAKNSFIGFNLINSLDGGASDATASLYTIDMNVSKATSTIATSLVYNKTKYDFVSNEIPVVQDYGSNLFKGFQANVNNIASMPLSNTNILITYNFIYPYAQFVDPDNKNNVFTLKNFYPNKENSASGGTPIDGVLYRPGVTYSPVIAGSYLIGSDFKVTTFTTDRTYQGTTGTNYTIMGNHGAYSSRTIFYRVILDISKNKASLVIYNAKFSSSETEPVKPVIYLPDLDLTWGNGTYTITGTDKEPWVIEVDKLEKLPDFTFANFRMEAVGQFMTEANITYTVINSVRGQNLEYKGLFQGSSVTIPDEMKR